MSIRLSCWKNIGFVVLDQVLSWGLESCKADTLLVVERKSIDGRGRESFEPGVKSAVDSLFRKNIRTCLTARCWPGTELIKSTARLYVINFDEAVKNRMVNAEAELFNWRNVSPKHLPEDICLLRDGYLYPFFASTTHEGDAYIVTDNTDKREVPAGFQESNRTIEQLMLAWDGPYCCQL